MRFPFLATRPGPRTHDVPPIRVALAGLGKAARDIHLPALKLLPGAVLVGAADPDEGVRAAFARARPDVPAWASVDELLAGVQADWLLVVTPPATHRAMCLQALARGLHVFCEKPFVERADEADAIIAAAHRAGRHVVVNHEFPCMEIFAAARALTGSARFGDVRFLQFWEHQLERPEDEHGWRAQCLTMREFGTHVVDLAIRLYGAFPERIYARMASPGGPPGSDLVDVVTLDFPGGRLASVVLDRVSHGPHRYLELRMDGQHASLRASFGGRASLHVGIEPRTRRPEVLVDLAAGGQAWLERAGRRDLVARNGINPFADATARHLAEALVDVHAGRAPATDARFAQAVVRVVEAAYASARTGESVRLDLAGVPVRTAAPAPPG